MLNVALVSEREFMFATAVRVTFLCVPPLFTIRGLNNMSASTIFMTCVVWLLQSLLEMTE